MKILNSLSKKYIMVSVLMIIMCTVLSTTYSNFIYNSQDYRASEMYIGGFLYTLRTDDNLSGLYEVKPGKSEVTVDVSSYSSINFYYKLAYSNNENIQIKYKSNNDLPYGSISANGSKRITLDINNTSNVNQEFELIIFSGYPYLGLDDIILDDNYTIIDTKSEVIVTFNANGGTTAASNKGVNIGEKYGTLALANRSNYRFLGWYTAAEGGERVLSSTEVTNDSDHTLYAQWKIQKTLDVLMKEKNSPVSDSKIDFTKSSEGKYNCSYNSSTGTQSCSVMSSQVTNGLYYTSNLTKTNDENGDGTGEIVYYYRGIVENNYLKFAGFCWRIVRINEDGSFKIRYNGSPDENGYCPQTGTNNNIGRGHMAYYSSTGIDEDTGYIGYMWPGNPLTANTTSYAQATQNNYDGTAKKVIDAWYADAIASQGEGVIDRIANTKYCNDRAINVSGALAQSCNTGLGYGDNCTAYGASLRLVKETLSGSNLTLDGSLAKPSLKCQNQNDQFTLSVAAGGTQGYGNNALTYPVALLTADEVVYAGSGVYIWNQSYFLNTGASTWTLSPKNYSGYSGAHYYFYIGDNGYLSSGNSQNYYVPVISLKKGTFVSSGEGLYNDPYIIDADDVSVNNGATHTNTRNVVLNLVSYAGSSMCISNSTTCTEYEPIEPIRVWQLDSGDGEKTIYIYFKDSNGNIISTIERKITLDTIGPTGGSVAISDGDTRTRTLTLNSEGADYVCVSNTSSDISNCDKWVNYNTSLSWSLSEGLGEKTIYVFFKDEAGNYIGPFTANATVTVLWDAYETFDDDSFAGDLTITGSGSYPWAVNSATGRFESTNKSVGSSTSSTTITFTPTSDMTLTFDYGVSSESRYDELTITLADSNGSSKTIANAISGTTTGSANEAVSANVTYTLTLSYEKDGSVNSNDDIGYIDNLIVQ